MDGINSKEFESFVMKMAVATDDEIKIRSMFVFGRD